MELTEYIRLVRRHWVAITATTMAGLLAGGAATALMTEEYASSTTLFVSVQSADSNSPVDALQGGSAAQQRVRSYVDVVTSARVLDPVINDLDLNVTAAQLASAVTATSPANSVLVDITVTDTDADQAAKIASAIGVSFRKVVADELETPLSGGPSLVKVETIQPAVSNPAPTSPRPLIGLALGGFFGLIAGVTLAALRSTLDTRVRGVDDIEELVAAPVLGGIAFDAEATRSPLVVQAAPRSPRAEAFRALRTNLRFVGIDGAARTFVVTSAMPAEGKSTTVANLAVAIAEAGERVVLVDGDLRRPRAAEIMGLDGTVGLSDVLIGHVELDDAVQPWGRRGLSVLPAGSIPPNPSELLGSGAMRAVIADLTSRFDVVLIDAPPVLPVTDAAVLTSLTSGALVVTATGKSRRPQLRAAVDSLLRVDARVLGTIVTMLPVKGRDAYGYATYTNYYGQDPATTAAGPESLAPVPALRGKSKRRAARRHPVGTIA